jgi:hypothetical protein
MTQQIVDTRRMNGDEGSGMARRPQGEGTMAIATTRASQEVQAAMVIAKNFPRDETAAIARIMQSCRRKALAEAAIYSYPRGTTTVEGPSIRLAEAMAQAWGNVDFGIVELEQKNGESQVMAYAWDLETNTRQTKIFAVPHKRHTRNGDMRLTDPRDIYEMVANQGARRLRACILGIIPGDVQDQALAQCNKTLASADGEPLIDRVRKMVVAFSDFGVSQDMIEARLGHKVDAISQAEFVNLRKIYQSMKDGAGSREDFFNPAAGETTVGESRTDKLADVLKGNAPAGDAHAAPASSRPGPRRQRQEADPEPAAKPPEETLAEPAAASEQHEAILNQAAEWTGGKSLDELKAFIIGHKSPALVAGAKRMAAVEKKGPQTEEDWRAVAENLRAAELELDAKGKK